MRELKFRSWTPANREPMAFSHSPAMLGVFFMCVVEWQREGRETTVMQFTGLTDVNGTEIYEGDVVKARYQPPEMNGFGNFKFNDYEVLMEVIFTESASVRGKNLRKSAKNSRNWATKSLADNGLSNLTVTGNIYETPTEATQ